MPWFCCGSVDFGLLMIDSCIFLDSQVEKKALTTMLMNRKNRILRNSGNCEDMTGFSSSSREIVETLKRQRVSSTAVARREVQPVFFLVGLSRQRREQFYYCRLLCSFVSCKNIPCQVHFHHLK